MENFQKPYHFKCIKCGNCCRDKGTIVNLTYKDLIRLWKGLNLDLKSLLEIIGFYVFDTKLTEEKKQEMVLPPIETERGDAFIALRKDEVGKCIFLSEKNSCKIYKHRPNICRTFPFNFNAKTVVGTTSRMEISMGLTEKAIEYCKGFSLEYSEIYPETWMEIGKNTVRDIVEEASLIKEWNFRVDEGEVLPIAENYIKLVLNFASKLNKPRNLKGKNKIGKPKSYQQIAREKLKNKKY